MLVKISGVILNGYRVVQKKLILFTLSYFLQVLQMFLLWGGIPLQVFTVKSIFKSNIFLTFSSNY